MLSPYLPEFPYAPNDARFLGSPIDFIVFNGLSAGDLTEIILIEVKTGNPKLDARARQIKRATDELRIRHELIRLPRPQGAAAVGEVRQVNDRRNSA